MATQESSGQQAARRNRSRKLGFAMLGIAALLMLAAVWKWPSIKGYARIGTAYSAHIVCSCRYIGGRDMESCATDREDGMGMIRLSEDTEKQRVYASIPFFGKAIAEKRGDYGCIVLNDAEVEALD